MNIPGAEKLRRLHILLAEDNLLNVKLASLVFIQNGLTFQVAENGRIAIEKIRNDHFDIVLMDMEMPVMNGYQATDLIRRELKNNIPIIAMTAHTRKGEREKCLQLGMNDYIKKPVDESLLLRSMIKLTSPKTPVTERRFIAVSKRTAAHSRRICNLDYLTAVTRGNREKTNSLLAVFLEEIPKELAALTAAIEKTNYPVICDIVHKIKCSFSILGIDILASPVDEMKDLSNFALGIKKIKQLNQGINLVFRQAMEELRTESGHTVSLLKTHL